MTYPEPAVAEIVNERLVPVQINTRDEKNKEIIQRYRQVWTPDIRVLDPEGYELYRWNGYLPPSEFIPQLLVALGQAKLRTGDLEGAGQVYEEAARRFPTSAAAPEALYYLAVSRYKASHEAADLYEGWESLRARHPDSIWRVRQLFSES